MNHPTTFSSVSGSISPLHDEQLSLVLFNLVLSCLSLNLFLSTKHLFLYLSSIRLHCFLYLRLLHKFLNSGNKTTPRYFPESYIPFLERIDISQQFTNYPPHSFFHLLFTSYLQFHDQKCSLFTSVILVKTSKDFQAQF